jgi:hypothetical protein
MKDAASENALKLRANLCKNTYNQVFFAKSLNEDETLQIQATLRLKPMRSS